MHGGHMIMWHVVKKASVLHHSADDTIYMHAYVASLQRYKCK